MNFDIVNVVTIGVIVAGVGTAVLWAMVRWDLAPAGRLAKRGQWLVATGLGSGILALAFKLVVIVALGNLPELLTQPVVADSDSRPHTETALTAHHSPRRVWPGQASGAEVSRDPQGVLPSTRAWEPLPFQAPAPAVNPTTPEKVALGERLFFDRRLSRDQTLSCADCHDVRHGSGTDRRATSRGIGGQMGSRNAPTVFNAAFQSALFWDGRAASLEEQAKGPLINPREMGMPTLAAVEERVKESPEYRAGFARAFGAGPQITIDRIAEAIAAYERTLITPDTPYDRFVRGDSKALSGRQLRGMALFQSLGCINCHSGPNFSAASLFDGRAPLREFPLFPTLFESRYDVTDSGAVFGGESFRVPSLRNVALTAPYFHNGSVTELAEAVRIMAAAQVGRTGRILVWSDRDKTLTELERPALDEAEIGDLVAFLQSLSSDLLVARMERNVRKMDGRR